MVGNFLGPFLALICACFVPTLRGRLAHKCAGLMHVHVLLISRSAPDCQGLLFELSKEEVWIILQERLQLLFDLLN